MNILRASSALTRARLAFYGTMGMCAYTTYWSLGMDRVLGQVLRKENITNRRAEDLQRRAYMQDHYVCSRENLIEGRYYTLITSAWNHGTPLHFLGNMWALWGFGRIIAFNFGARAFISLFYGGAILGNLCSLGLDSRSSNVVTYTLDESRLSKTSQGRRAEGGFIGASAGIEAIVAAFTCIRPWSSRYISIIPIPVPNVIVTLGFAIFSVYAQLNNFQPDIAHLGHLGGLVYGCLWYISILR